MIVYLATNLLSGKAYIGLTTVSLSWRKDKHYKNAERYYNTGKKNTHFHNALLKYDESVWQWRVLEDNIIDIKLLKQREVYWIAFYKNIDAKLYNLTDGGDGILGLRFTNTAEGKANKSKAQLGNKKWLGKHHTEETKSKMSESNKGKNAKTYSMLSPTSITTEITNMRQFCKDNSLDNRAMLRVISKEHKQHKGWRLS